MYPLKPDTITLGMLVAITICCTVIIVSFRPLSLFLLLADLLNTTPGRLESWKLYRALLIRQHPVLYAPFFKWV